jgi:molybdate transport system substrate-binding protein
VVALAALAAGCAAHNCDSGILTVSVAASLQSSMTELAPVFERSQPGVKLRFNFGASGTLEQQIEQGAPVDVFFSAAPKPMDALAKLSLLLPDTRRDILRNRIVLIAPRDKATPDSFESLTAGAVKLIALGDPLSVPAGDYGRQTLESLKLWNAVQSKLVLAKDVRQVLTYVETGNAEAGIVYATDATESEKVRVAATAPEGSHAAVIYPAAVIAGSRNQAAARTFVSFLTGSEARKTFTRHGFTMVSP